MKKEIETQIRYKVLLEDNQKKDEKLKKLECEIKKIELELSHILEKQEEDQRTIELIRRKTEKYRKTIKELSREKEKAQAEAQLYTRSIFGIYRKRRKGKGEGGAKMVKGNK